MNRPSPLDELNEAGHMPAAAATTETEPPSGLSARTFPLESGVERDHRRRPCTKCLWLTSTDLTELSDEDMDMLRRANGRPGAEAPADAPIVACHRDRPGTAPAMRWCAGLPAVVGEQHLGVRLALAFEALPPQAVNPPANWPELYPDPSTHWWRPGPNNSVCRHPRRPREEGDSEAQTTTPTALDTVGVPVHGGTHHDDQ